MAVKKQFTQECLETLLFIAGLLAETKKTAQDQAADDDDVSESALSDEKHRIPV